MSFRRAGAFRTLALLTICALHVTAEAPPGLPADSKSYISIADFGAKPNGSDATRAITAAIKKARNTAGKCVYLPAGYYQCGPLTLDSVKLVGAGSERTILTAPDPVAAIIKLTGKDSGLFNLKLVTLGKERIPGQDRIQVDWKADTFYVSNVTVDGSNAAGIIVYGGANGRITGNRVINTKADAIHMTAGAHNIYVAGNYVRNSGDDCIAVVTYDQNNPDPLNDRNILIENNDVGYQTWGRGISVIGGDNVTIRHNKITKTSMAGIYVVSETPYHTRGISQVVVEDNTLISTPFLRPEMGHPSILLYSDTHFKVTKVKIINNQMVHSPNGPFRIDAGTENIFCSGNTCDGKPADPSNAVGTGKGVIGATITSSFLRETTTPFPAPTSKRTPLPRRQDSRTAPLNID